MIRGPKSNNLRGFEIHLVRKYKIRKISRQVHSIEMHAKPYDNTSEIESIDTHLSGLWRYSPLFKTPIANVDIELTGSRRNDYKLAEATAKCVHVPGSTVWHHAWMKDASGKYRMQLVDFTFHQRTCPHAGGCKLWSINHGMAYKSNGNVYVNEALMGKSIMGKTVRNVGRIDTEANSVSYSDFVIDYIFDYDNSQLSNMPLNQFLINSRRGKSAKVWGIDPYGNLFLSDAKRRLYFWDHERGKLIALSIHESDILR